MGRNTAQRVKSNSVAKGDVLSTARFAGVQAAKETASYFPFTHPTLVSRVTVEFNVADDFIDVLASVEHSSDQSARLHALTAATVAAMTIYDMCKSLDRTMVIGPTALES